MTDERVITFPPEVVLRAPFGRWHRISDDVEVRVLGHDDAGTLRVRAAHRGGEDLGALLYEMYRDSGRLIDMLDRHGHLWAPEPGRAHPDVERLPLLAARIVAAAMHQPDPREDQP